jgi:hypothetical protein
MVSLSPLSGIDEGVHMNHSTPVQQHNYLTKMAQMWQSGALPREAGYHQVAVAHDDWCGIFAGQRCDGHLAIKLQWSQPAAA